MQPLKAYIICTVWGTIEGVVAIADVKLAHTEPQAAAMATDLARRSKPDLPPLLAITIVDVPEDTIAHVLNMLRTGGKPGEVVHLELIKPEGSA